MKKLTTRLLFALMLLVTVSRAQTAMQLSGPDCNGVSHDLFADLDAGKAVLLHFFMSSCGSCPPPALKIQAMANRILAAHPGKITAYAMPYENTTTCAYTSTWVSSNGLSLYMPYDSGAAQVAHYGGFGMPTVVLLGGTDHRVMFSTQSFSTSDTTLMRDSILALLTGSTGIADLHEGIASFSVSPNPANDNIQISLTTRETSKVMIDIIDISGKQVAIICDEKRNGLIKKQFNTSSLPGGIYFVRLQMDGKTTTQKLTLIH